MCYIDGILVTGRTEEEHLHNLEEVLRRLQKHGVCMKQGKCSLMKNSVENLGHKVDTEGIHAMPQKTAAIEKAPTPKKLMFSS